MLPEDDDDDVTNKYFSYYTYLTSTFAKALLKFKVTDETFLNFVTVNSRAESAEDRNKNRTGFEYGGVAELIKST